MGYALSNAGRKRLDEFLTSFHQQVGVAPGQEFSVEPNAVQQIVAKAHEEDGGWFLQMISAYQWVEQMKGEKIGLSVNGLISSRTDTSSGKNRVPRQVHELDDTGYELHQINRDVALRYNVIDTWRHRPEFAQLWAAAVRRAMINDILRVGWHGVKAEKDTDRTASPNGEDVARGWLQELRETAANQIDETGTTIGEGGDYRNLDHLAFEAKQLIDPQFREDPGIRVMCAADLLQLSQGRYYEQQGDTPSEKNHLDNGRILETYGGMRSIKPPYIPDGTLVIANPKNLAHYVQSGSNRRNIIDASRRDQVEDYNSANEGYVIEETRAIAVISNIKAGGQ